MTYKMRTFRSFYAFLIRSASKFLIKQYISIYSVRSCYTFVKSLSNKTIFPLAPNLHQLFFGKLKLYLIKQYLYRDCSTRILVSDKLYQVERRGQPKFSPRVSIIVPIQSNSKFLRSRLNSIYEQTYSNFEVIFLVDALTSENQIILEEYQGSYPDITRLILSNKNSQTRFRPWLDGVKAAHGDLIWVAKADDYCSHNLLTELIKYFENSAVMLAYCKSKLAAEGTTDSIWDIEESKLWADSLVKSAHQLVNKVWAIKNIIPSIGSAVFRRPLLLDKEDSPPSEIFADWIFYLEVIRGGLVAYSKHAFNYYRFNEESVSNIYSNQFYYQEYEHVAAKLVSLYRIEKEVLERQRDFLESRRNILQSSSEDFFKQYYDFGKLQSASIERKPNLLMVSFALTVGGGETFPIRLSNLLKNAGYGITFLNCRKAPTEIGVRQMLRQDIPLLELESLEKLDAVVDDMGIELVHSHHIWTDVGVSYFLEKKPNIPLIVTTHGMYEMTNPIELGFIIPLLRKRVSKFVYLTKKNLPVFISHGFDIEQFVKVGNAIDILPITPISRITLGVPENAFLICLVSRAIPEKGWQEAIEAVKLARKISLKDIHLLLIGEGPEYERLKSINKDDFIHLLGFRANVRDYFATSDLGLLPSRYLGESFPLVLIECLRSNRPVLASNIGEIKDMVSTDEGSAGTVFELDNWTIPIMKVAASIITYIENRQLYLEHLRQVPKASAKFDPVAMLNKYENLYLELHGKNLSLAKTWYSNSA